MDFILYFNCLLASFSKGNCSSCSAVFSVLKKRVRLVFGDILRLERQVCVDYRHWFKQNVFVLQRNCSNCGNSFCSRCCSYKVLRSCMGATGEHGTLHTASYGNNQSLSNFVVNFPPFFVAPEAQRETVFVCAACNSSLIKLQWDASSLFRPEPCHRVTGTLAQAVAFMTSVSFCQDTSCTKANPPCRVFAILQSFSFCLQDIYCISLNISSINCQKRNRINGSWRDVIASIEKDLHPLCWAEGGVVWRAGGAGLILLECRCLYL